MSVCFPEYNELSKREKKIAENILCEVVPLAKKSVFFQASANCSFRFNINLVVTGQSLVLRGQKVDFAFPKLCDMANTVFLGDTFNTREAAELDTRKTWKFLEHSLMTPQLVRVTTGAHNLSQKLKWILGLNTNIRVELTFSATSYDLNKRMIEATVVKKGYKFRYGYTSFHFFQGQDPRPSAITQRFYFASCLRWGYENGVVYTDFMILAAVDTTSKFYNYLTFLKRLNSKPGPPIAC